MFGVLVLDKWLIVLDKMTVIMDLAPNQANISSFNVHEVRSWHNEQKLDCKIASLESNEPPSINNYFVIHEFHQNKNKNEDGPHKVDLTQKKELLVLDFLL